MQQLFRDAVRERRAGNLRHPRNFWFAAERLPLVQTVYGYVETEPQLVPPESESRKTWERPDAVRELVRGRMEIAGPMTARALAELLDLPLKDIDTALLALEAEGFVLRRKFHPGHG